MSHKVLHLASDTAIAVVSLTILVGFCWMVLSY